MATLQCRVYTRRPGNIAALYGLVAHRLWGPLRRELRVEYGGRSLPAEHSVLLCQAKAPQCIIQCCTPLQLGHAGLQAEVAEPWHHSTLRGISGRSPGNAQHSRSSSSLFPAATSSPSILFSSRSTSRTGGSSRVHAGHTDVSPISYTLVNSH